MTYCFNLTEITIALIGAIGASALITVRITKKKSVVQRNNNIRGGGDIVGGNKTTN